MKLSKDDTDLFYRLHKSLLVYANKKLNMINNVNSIEALEKIPMEKTSKLILKLYESTNLIASFAETNPCNFSTEELSIVKSWKNFVRDKFLIMKYLEKYTIFLNTTGHSKAYGVFGLVNTFEELLGPFLPVMAETILLPFKDKITYCGNIITYPIHFGGGITRGFKDSYEEAKFTYGIITSLPFIPEKKEENNEKKLKFYLKNQRNRDTYLDEIFDLIGKNENLLTVYHQEMGKIHSRSYAKRLREIGFSDGWFAILEGIVVASGMMKKDVEKTLKKLLPAEKLKFTYFFQLKKKGG